MNVHLVRMLLLYFILLVTSTSLAQETEQIEATTSDSNNDSNNVSSSSDQLNTNLRDALLKALSDLESNDDNDETQEFSTKNKQNIERAQANTITLFGNVDEQGNISLPEDLQHETQTNENQIITTFQDMRKYHPQIAKPQETSSDDTPVEKANEVIFQKSNAIEGIPITSVEKEPLNFFRDAEQIITSASNSFITQNSESDNTHTPRSIKDTELNTKITSFSNLNTITGFESKTALKENVERFSDDEPVDELPLVKTYIKLLGNDEYSKSSATSEAKNIKNGESRIKTSGNDGNTEVTTAAAVEVSTEENEAKVEQVQFFSAPLVAAFTVHQDAKGQPKKVEPIYKNELNPKKEEISVQQNSPQQNANLQFPSFNNLELQKKQQIFQQELDKLRNQQLLQQERLLSRNNIENNQGLSNSISNTLGLTQSSFKQAVNENFNQYDPIFSEPDRSVITKLATIDPSTLLAQNGGLVLNKFTPSEAILPTSNPVKSNFVNQIMPDSKSRVQNQNNKGEVTLVPSITFNPIIEAGKLPLNAQILPNKEPTGFLNFVPQNQQASPQIKNSVTSRPIVSLPTENLAQTNPVVSKASSNLVLPSSTLVKSNSHFAQPNFNYFNSNSLSQTQQNLIRPNLVPPIQHFPQSTSNIIQPSVSTFVSSAGQNNGQNQLNSNFLGNQIIQTGLNPVQVSQPNGFSAQTVPKFNNDGRGQSLNQNNDFLNSNRILRQEQGSGNLGLNQNSFSIIPSQQPFKSTHEISYSQDNNKFLRQNQGNTLSQPTNFLGQNFNVNGQNAGFFQTNLDGSRNFNEQSSKLNFQGAQNNLFNGNSQNQNGVFRSNFVGSLQGTNNLNIQQSVQPFGQQIVNYSPQYNRFFRANQEGTLNTPQNFVNNQNLGYSPLQNFEQINPNNRFFRSNVEGTFLGNQNRFSVEPTLQNYRYSNSFGFRTIPLNKK